MRIFYRELIILFLVCFTINVFSKDNRQVIAVIDTGITINSVSRPYMCTEGHKDFTGTGLQDNNGHGTNVVGLIARGLDYTKYCIIMIKFYNTDIIPTMYEPEYTLNSSWAYLKTLKPKFVNLSYSGTGFYRQELDTLRFLTDNGSMVLVSSGNNAKDLSKGCNYYPACYKITKNFYVVGISDAKFGNYGGPVNILQPGYQQRVWGTVESGTSQSCANATNKMAREQQ